MMDNKKLKAYLAFAAVCFFWGTTYLAIRIGVKDFPPVLFVGIRQLIAGLLMCGYFMLIKGEKIPAWPELKKILIGGSFFILGANMLMTLAEVHLSSGVAALIATFLPFYILIINFIRGKQELLTWLAYLGLAIGGLGMLFIFYDSLSDLINPEYLSGMIMMFVSCISWAFGSIYMKSTIIKTNSLFSSGLQMLFIGFGIMSIAVFTTNFSEVNFKTETIFSLAYLVVFGSLIGYGSFIYAVSKLETTLFSMYAYVNTIVAVILGVIVLNEKVTLKTIIAIIFTIGGVYLVSRGYRKISIINKKEIIS